jgi:hypothetical protein
MSSMSRSVDRNDLVMLSVIRVRGPFHASHWGSESSCGRWYMMSEDRRCGIF